MRGVPQSSASPAAPSAASVAAGASGAVAAAEGLHPVMMRLFVIAFYSIS